MELVVTVSSHTHTPHQSYPQLFFLHFFLLTFALPFCPPYSWLIIDHLVPTCHAVSVIPGHSRNEFKQNQRAIFVCFTNDLHVQYACCDGDHASVHGLQTYLKKDFQLHLRTTPASLRRPEARGRTTFTHASVCDPDSDLSSTLLPFLSPASILKSFKVYFLSLTLIFT